MPGETLYFFEPTGGAELSRVYRGPLRADGFDMTTYLPVGYDRDWIVRIRPVGPPELYGTDDFTLMFSGYELLSGYLWEGINGIRIADISGRWLDNNQGIAVYTLPNQFSLLLEPNEVYNLRLEIALTDVEGSRKFVVAEGLVRTLPIPGSVAITRGPLYCASQDVDYEAPWSDDERIAYSTRAGWLDERDAASQWVRRNILARSRKGRIARLPQWTGMDVNYARPWDFVLIPNFDITSDIEDALNNDRLYKNDLALVKATAQYACSEIREIKKDPDVRDRYFTDAVKTMFSYIARVDIDGDGYYETWISV